MNDAENDDVLLLDRPVIVVDDADLIEDDIAFEAADDDFETVTEEVILLDTMRLDDGDLDLV